MSGKQAMAVLLLSRMQVNEEIKLFASSDIVNVAILDSQKSLNCISFGLSAWAG